MRRHRIVATLLGLFCSAVVSPAVADSQEADAYLDDRSTGESVVRSLYSAINRKEYLRAYSYFGESADLPDYESYADGYADTEHVQIKLGEAVDEGAAGSIFTSVPLAILATRTNGEVQIYSGCIVLRLAQPTVQGTPPFQPRHIEKADLEPVSGDFENLNPRCDNP